MLIKSFSWLLAALLLGGCGNTDTKSMQESAKTETKKIETAVSNGMSGAKLKSVLLASSKLDASHISVEKKDNTFYLRGTVVSAEQDTLAKQIAQDTVGKGDKLVDDLKVEGGGSSPSPDAKK